MLPARFPIQQIHQSFRASFSVTFLSSSPDAIARLLPVKSSAPAMTTRLSATPKERPITILAYGRPVRRPPDVNASSTPIPMYAPASIDTTKYASGSLFMKATFAAAPSEVLV